MVTYWEYGDITNAAEPGEAYRFRQRYRDVGGQPETLRHQQRAGDIVAPEDKIGVSGETSRPHRRGGAITSVRPIKIYNDVALRHELTGVTRALHDGLSRRWHPSHGRKRRNTKWTENAATRNAATDTDWPHRAALRISQEPAPSSTVSAGTRKGPAHMVVSVETSRMRQRYWRQHDFGGDIAVSI